MNEEKCTEKDLNKLRKSINSFFNSLKWWEKLIDLIDSIGKLLFVIGVLIVPIGIFCAIIKKELLLLRKYVSKSDIFAGDKRKIYKNINKFIN